MKLSHATLGPRIHEFAEDRRENVGEAFEAPAGASERPLAIRSILEGRMAEPVVCSALLGILQAVIGLVDGLELRLMFLAAAFAVRMAIFCHLAIRSLNCRVVGVLWNAEQLIIIRGHQSPPMTNGADRWSVDAVRIMASEVGTHQ